MSRSWLGPKDLTRGQHTNPHATRQALRTRPSERRDVEYRLSTHQLNQLRRQQMRLEDDQLRTGKNRPETVQRMQMIQQDWRAHVDTEWGWVEGWATGLPTSRNVRFEASQIVVRRPKPTSWIEWLLTQPSQQILTPVFTPLRVSAHRVLQVGAFLALWMMLLHPLGILLGGCVAMGVEAGAEGLAQRSAIAGFAKWTSTTTKATAPDCSPAPTRSTMPSYGTPASILP